MKMRILLMFCCVTFHSTLAINLNCSGGAAVDLTEIQLHNRKYFADSFLDEYDAVLDICFDVPHGSMSNVTAAHWNIAVESEAGGSVAAGTLSIPGCFRDHLSIDSLGLNSLHFTLTESTNTSVCQLWDPFLSYRTYDREVCYSLALFTGDTYNSGHLFILDEQHKMLKLYIVSPRPNDSSQRLALRYEAAGAIPVLTLTNGLTVIQVQLLWSKEDYMWTSILNSTALTDSPFWEAKAEMTAVIPGVGGCVVGDWTGTVAVFSKVPILQWISNLTSHQVNTVAANISSSATLYVQVECYPDIAFAVSENLIWISDNLFRNSHRAFNICSLGQLTPSQCSQLVVFDMAATESKLFLLTSLGLLHSNKSSDTAASLVLFSGAPFNSLEQGARIVPESRALCHFNLFGEETLLLQIPKGLNCSGHPVVDVYSGTHPFERWSLLAPLAHTVALPLSVTYDFQRTIHVAAVCNTNNSVSVFKFNPDNSTMPIAGFSFPPDLSFSGLLYHSYTGSIYVFGSQLWLSVDDGEVFTCLLILPEGEVFTSVKLSEMAAMFLANTGRVYYSRPGSNRVVRLTFLIMNSRISGVFFGSSGLPSFVVQRYTNDSVFFHYAVIPVFSLFEPQNITFQTISVSQHTVYLLSNATDALHDSVNINIGSSAFTESLGVGVVSDTFSLVNSSGLVVSLQGSITGRPGERDTTIWTFWEDVCFVRLKGVQGNRLFELDIDDRIEFIVESEWIGGRSAHAEHLFDITVTFGNPDLLKFSVNSTTHRIVVTVWPQATNVIGESTMVLNLLYGSLVCPNAMLVLLVKAGCPSNKRMSFNYPTNFHQDLLSLAVNYRPPSTMGYDIYFSPHMYNVDPLQNTPFGFSKVPVQFKQCKDKISREECGCSQRALISTSIDYTDCIQEVYKHLFPLPFLLNFTLHHNDELLIMDYSIELEELNGRIDYQISGQEDISIIQNTSEEKHLLFLGSELYHFKATALSVSSCVISTQFTIFITNSPLTTTAEHCLSIATAAVFGIVTFVIYLWHKFHYTH